jgi:Glucodextranase, domain B
MTIARTSTSRRRPPAPVDRYRAVARAAKQRRARRKLPPILTGIVWGIVLASAALLADTAVVGIGYATGSLGSFVTTLIPAPVPVAELTVAETTGQVGAAPVLDGTTPQFTKDNALIVQGIVPSFGRAADRKVSIAINGGAAVLVPYDANGHFALSVTLADGTNQLFVALVSPIDTIALTSVAIVVDKTAPPLALTRPKNGDTIDGTNLIVEGKAEPGATVLVNDRSVIVGQDGSFSDTVTVPAGALPLTVIARDRAGNETKTQLSVTMNGKPTLGAAAIVSVTLTNASVKPGGYVNANINITNSGQPVVGQQVSLQVGVIPIGTAVTDSAGHTAISFAAPPNEGIAQVVVLAGNASGSAILTIAK